VARAGVAYSSICSAWRVENCLSEPKLAIGKESNCQTRCTCNAVLDAGADQLSPHGTNVSPDIDCHSADSPLTDAIQFWKDKFMRSNLPKYPTVALILIAGIGLSGCATKGFVREQIAVVNTRIDGLDGQLRTVEGTSGQALAQAQAAAGQSQQNGQRIDQINSRVDGLDQQMQMQAKQRQRKPRG